MKKIIPIIVCLAFSLWSCSLDQEPTTSWSDTGYYKTEGQIKALVNGALVRLQSTLGVGFMVYGDMRSDLYELANSGATEVRDILNNNITAYNSYCNWRDFFYAVQQANLVLENAPKMYEKGILSEETYKDVLGQAYCLRAFVYFWLARIWGDVPILLKPSVATDWHSDAGRDNVEAVFEQILSDLSEARKYLKDNGNRTRFTTSASWAIEAQVHAWRKNWDGVLSACEKIKLTEYPLANLYDASYSTADYDFKQYISTCPYAKVFNAGKQKESIFELSYSIDDNSESRALYRMVASSEIIHPSNASINDYKTNKSKDWRYFINFYDDKKVTKYFIDFSDMTSETRNVVLLRSGEIVLLEAEANFEKACELGSAGGGEPYLAKAFVALNKIRNRAGGASYEYVASDYSLDDEEMIRSMIAEERRIELYGEGYRYFDLIRTGKVQEVMQAINGQTDLRSTLWPVYYTEIVYSNGKITQNEYYR